MIDFTKTIDIPLSILKYIEVLYGKEFLEDNVSEKISYADLLAIITHGLQNKKHNRRQYSCAENKEAIGFVATAMERMRPNGENYEFKACEDSEYMFSDFFKVPFPPPENPKFTFIDLFAGMGGFRLGMQAQGGKWNKFAQKTYFANYGEMPFGGITKESTKAFIPNKFDVLCAGFPCQPFSIAGVSKKRSLGRETGFKDKTQGTLFFEVADIINRHRPKAFYLENVKNLTSHDKGRTFKVITETLEELNYSIHYKVIDGKHYVPQHRERIMIVGFDKNLYHGEENFEFPEDGEPINAIKDILLPNPDPKYTLTDKLWDYLQNYAVKQKAKGNGFGYGLVDMNGITRTLSARYYKDGSEILIPQNKKNPRRLTPRECARLMGYPDSYILDAVSDVQGYRQCGNSVVVPLITAVSEQLVKAMIK